MRDWRPLTMGSSDHGSDASGREPSVPKITVVGIGASAGGLKALTAFFEHVPERPGVAFAVVMHLSPEHESHLPELLQPHCRLPVAQVTETVPMEVDHVYVIPPNANLESVDSHLRLSELEGQEGRRARIDTFFRTLSETHDGHAVGVVLSGTGSDGTQGLRWIHDHRGLSIVQSPQEAEYDGMPRSAIAAGHVDLVLPVADMLAAILRFAGSAPAVAVSEEGETQDEGDLKVLQRVFAQLRVRTGHDFARYKRSTILRRIQRRMQLGSVASLPDYFELLRDHPDEVKQLVDDLLITVTEFFRDPQVFEHLQDQVIPDILQRKANGQSVRVWSVGCSTGEEVYSLAMLLTEVTERLEANPQLHVFASDLHKLSLAKAREGVYPDSIAENVSPQRLERFFDQDNCCYRVKRELREMVVFAPHNVLKDPPFSHLDLVVCRNLLIYLQREAQEDVVALLHYALNPEGLLVLGTSESIGSSDLFFREHQEYAVYRRRNVPIQEARLPTLRFSPGRALTEDPHPHQPRRPASFGGLHAEMVEQYAPPSVLINQNHDVVHYSAHVRRYLTLPGGDATHNIIRLVEEPLRAELRAALHDASKSGEIVRSRPVEMTVEGKPRTVAVQVRPATEGELRSYFLVIFDEGPEIRPSEPAGEEAGQANAPEIESELNLAKQRLQTVIHEYETTQEQMQAANEELQSTNEELRSAMEELETSKEELQSMNEELTSLNQENRHHVEDLIQLSGDLQNLLTATDIATLFLDRELRIVRFTPKVAEVFSILNTDQGRPLSDLTHRLAGPHLLEDARQVLDRLVPVMREVQSEDGRWFQSRFLPYRTPDDRIEGVVLTLMEITDRKTAEKEIQQARDYAEAIIETLPEPLLVLNPDLTVKTANPSFYEHFRVASAQTEGRRIYDLGNRQWDIPELRTLLEDVLPDNEVFYGYQVEHDFEGLGHRVMLVNARRLDHVQLILLGLHDITERYEAEQAVVAARDDLERRVRERTAELEQQKVRLQHLARELAAAEHRERKRLAALLHDDLQQYLVAMRMHIASMRHQKDRESIDRTLGKCAELLDQAMQCSRDLTHQLRPPVLYETGVVPALHWLASEFQRRHEMDVHVEAAPVEDPLTDDMRVMVFESVRELLLNVAKHAGVKHAAVAVEQSEGWLRCTVSDRGPGFDMEKLARSEQESGSLGLFSIRERLDVIGGTMRIRSNPGTGTRIVLDVPMDLAAGPPAAMRESSARPGGKAGPRALIVDDHAIVRQGLATLIGEDGRVQLAGQAGNGIEAIEAVEQLEPDVVLMDVNMSLMNGLDATREIHRRWPHIHIVGLSVQDDSATVASMREAGAGAFVSKGDTADSLVRTILNLVAAK